jgi:hypothetical protein
VYIYFPFLFHLQLAYRVFPWLVDVNESSVYLGFTDGSSRHTWNLASAAWVVYSPEGLLVSSGGICLGPSMNNVDEYSIVIEILRDAISHGILSLEVFLDS